MIYLGEGIVLNELQGFCCEGEATAVSDLVNGFQKSGFVSVVVQPELALRRCFKRGHANVDTVRSDVKVLHKCFDKVSHLGKFLTTHTAGRVQQELDVSLHGVTDWPQKKSDNCRLVS